MRKHSGQGVSHSIPKNEGMFRGIGTDAFRALSLAASVVVRTKHKGPVFQISTIKRVLRCCPTTDMATTARCSERMDGWMDSLFDSKPANRELSLRFGELDGFDVLGSREFDPAMVCYTTYSRHSRLRRPKAGAFELLVPSDPRRKEGSIVSENLDEQSLCIIS